MRPFDGPTNFTRPRNAYVTTMTGADRAKLLDTYCAPRFKNGDWKEQNTLWRDSTVRLGE